MTMKLEHANLTVRSIKESVRFLSIAFPDCSIRGEGAIHGDPARGRWVHFGNEAFYVALQENSEPGGRSDITYLHEGINHLGFEVTELDEMVVRLNRGGYAISPDSAMDSHPFRRRAYFFDNNGVEWEFVEYRSVQVAERNDYNL